MDRKIVWFLNILFFGVCLLISSCAKNHGLSDTTFKSVSGYPAVVPIEADCENHTHIGSGFIIDKKNGFIATVDHTASHIKINSDNYFIHVFIGSVQYPAKVVWRNSFADVSVLKLDGEFKLPSQINAAPEEGVVGNEYVLVGYQVGYLGGQRSFLNREIRTKLIAKNTPLIDVIRSTGISERREFLKKKKEDPDLKFEDLYYTKYVGVETAETIVSFLKGMSGGALLDSNNNAIAIVTMYHKGKLAFIPIREIPEKYFGK